MVTLAIPSTGRAFGPPPEMGPAQEVIAVEEAMNAIALRVLNKNFLFVNIFNTALMGSVYP
jgi:hypothetical protein